MGTKLELRLAGTLKEGDIFYTHPDSEYCKVASKHQGYVIATQGKWIIKMTEMNAVYVAVRTLGNHPEQSRFAWRR